MSEESESDSSGEEEEGDGEGAHEKKVATNKKESRKGGDAATKKATSKGDESKIDNEVFKRFSSLSKLLKDAHYCPADTSLLFMRQLPRGISNFET